ncbi:MAG: hypothetical protein WBE61_03995 [Nitrososphaeraceae archaeon]
MRRRSNNYIYTDSNYTRISGKQINNNNNNKAAIIRLVVFMTRTKGFGMDSLFGNRANS